MKISFLLLALLFFLSAFSGKAQAQSTESDKFVILPIIGYSSDIGLGLGASGVWQGVGGSSWNNISTLFLTTQYNQLFASTQLVNRKLFNILFADLGTAYIQSQRNFFYGLGNNSSVGNYTQYGIVDSSSYAKLGVDVWQGIVLGAGLIYKTTGLNRGNDPTASQYFDIYPNDPLASGTTNWATTLFAQYDTRQSLAPQSGDFAIMSWDQNQPLFGSTLSLQRFRLEGLRYWLIQDKVLTILSRAKYEHVWGEGVPFYLKPRLGGQNTLRGYVHNRFIDAASFLINVEPRWTFWNVGGSWINRMELSLGLDIGRVFERENVPPFDPYHTNWDIGLTAITGANVPIRLDYAVAGEQNLFYLHLLYPF